MSLLLMTGTKPVGLSVKSVSSGLEAEIWGGDGVHIGEYIISREDFFAMALYVLTNTNLEGETDPRLKFVAQVQKMKTVEGFSDNLAKNQHELRRLIVSR